MFRTLFLSVWFLLHPVHVTLTSVDYVPEINSLKVFIRIYYDDFLLDCKQNGGDLQDVDFSAGSPSSRKAMEKYLGKMVLITVNDTLLTGRIIDMKLTDNEISMNLDYGKIKNPESITVKNQILTSLYNDQSNMLIVKINDFEEGARLTPELSEKTFRIK
ncbi:MAG TPA: hypothetical protein PLR88_06415 [Bacteroidales bacterium]|nr:hypothetical protein [Bacteroidales bacterium]HPT21561.1 hypothetical protein [Bacteroidales bacterium]